MKQKVMLLLSFMLGISLLSAVDMYGAFRIITTPKRADVTLYDIDLYLCQTPSPVYPVLEEEGIEIREGIPGRAITIMITKEGYVPLKKEIFVPFVYADQDYALENPTVFSFELKRDRRRTYTRLCYYYSYHNPRPRWHYHRWHPGFYPWCPPGFVYNPGGGHHGGGGHNSGFDPGQDNLPDGGHYVDDDNHPGGGGTTPGTHYGVGLSTTPPNSEAMNHKDKIPGPGSGSGNPNGPDRVKPDRIIVTVSDKPNVGHTGDRDKPEETVKPPKPERNYTTVKPNKTEGEKVEVKAPKRDKGEPKTKYVASNESKPDKKADKKSEKSDDKDDEKKDNKKYDRSSKK